MAGQPRRLSEPPKAAVGGLAGDARRNELRFVAATGRPPGGPRPRRIPEIPRRPHNHQDISTVPAQGIDAQPARWSSTSSWIVMPSIAVSRTWRRVPRRHHDITTTRSRGTSRPPPLHLSLRTCRGSPPKKACSIFRPPDSDIASYGQPAVGVAWLRCRSRDRARVFAIAVAHTQALVRSPRTPRCSTVLHGAPRCPGGTPPVVHPVPRRPGLVRPGPREPCY